MFAVKCAGEKWGKRVNNNIMIRNHLCKTGITENGRVCSGGKF